MPAPKPLTAEHVNVLKFLRFGEVGRATSLEIADHLWPRKIWTPAQERSCSAAVLCAALAKRGMLVRVAGGDRQSWQITERGWWETVPKATPVEKADADEFWERR